MSAQTICVVQAGLRSELDIATDEMERAQRQLAALEKQREVLQQGSAAASPRAAPAATAISALEDSLRKELQSQVGSVCVLEQDMKACCITVCVTNLMGCVIMS